MSPDRKPSQNQPTRLSKELAEHVERRTNEEDRRLNPNGEYNVGDVFEIEDGLVVRTRVQMKWIQDYLRKTGRLRNAPRRPR